MTFIDALLSERPMRRKGWDRYYRVGEKDGLHFIGEAEDYFVTIEDVLATDWETEG